MKRNNATAGLYLHVPFCRRKCLYCDFCSYAGKDEQTFSAYTERMCAELVARADEVAHLQFDTVYFGGGTPTLLSPALLARLLDTVRAHYALSPDAEITSECNPATVDARALSALRESGINRLSMGMQSAQDGELAALGRIHTAAEAIDTFRAARAVGFDNLSLDLMYGIPTQTRESFARTLDTVLSLDPEHVSAYNLILEQGTPFYDARDSLPLPDEDEVCAMTDDALARLRGAGYARYEISNFAKRGRESRHNLHYWRMDDYLGVGIAAHSLIGDKRYQNRPDLDAYLGGLDVRESEETLSTQSAMDEYVMLALRLAEGIDKRAFADRFGQSFDDRYGSSVARFATTHLLSNTPHHIAFTDTGFAVSNAVLSEMLFE